MPLSKRLYAPASLALMSLLTLSGRLHGHGDLSERVQEMRAKVTAHPEDGQLQFELASLLSQEERFTDTLTVLDRLDQLAPGKYLTDNLRGSALLALGRAGEARAALDRFLKLHPGNVPAMTLRARALTVLDLKEDAVAVYREALKLSPAPEPDLVQEVAAALAGAGLPEEALQVLDTGLKIQGTIPSLATRALELELSLKKFDAALARAAALQKGAPRPEPWMARQAEILTIAGRISESRTAWQALVNHLAALPAAERGSHAMSRLAEQAHEGLRALQGLATLPAPASVSQKSSTLSIP